MRTTLLKLAVASAVAGGAIGAAALATTALPGPCGEDAPATSERFARQPAGSDMLAAVLGDSVITVSESGKRVRHPHLGVPGGMLRHAAGDPRFGIAYVNDLKGPDHLALVMPDGAPVEHPQPGEVTHPAWSPDGDLAWVVDGRSITVRSPDGGERITEAPDELRSVFSPVFTSSGELLVVGSEPAAGYEGEDDALDNLWSVDPATGAWERVTDFVAAGDAWSIIRTPVPMDDGSIRFIRVAGLASATVVPESEVWELFAGSATLIDARASDSYLAGALGGDLVYNVPGTLVAEWRLVRDRKGEAIDLGCGAVMVDPVSQIDPDLAAPVSQADAATASALGLPVVSIIVGDFATRAEAEAVAQRLSVVGAFQVVTNAEAPTAVAPGVWAVMRPLATDAVGQRALDELRERFPELEARSWLTAI